MERERGKLNRKQAKLQMPQFPNRPPAPASPATVLIEVSAVIPEGASAETSATITVFQEISNAKPEVSTHYNKTQQPRQ